MAADAIIRVRLNASKAAPSSPYSVYAGNTVELTFVCTDEQDALQDLTGWTGKYKLRLTTGGEVWTGGKPVTITADQTSSKGECTLALSSSDTAPLSGQYNHLLVLTDASGNIGTYMVGSATFTPLGV